MYSKHVLVGLALALAASLIIPLPASAESLGDIFNQVIKKAQQGPPNSQSQDQSGATNQAAGGITANAQSQEGETAYFDYLAAIADSPQWNADITTCYEGYGQRMTKIAKRSLQESSDASESKEKAIFWQKAIPIMDQYYPMIYKAACVKRLWTIIWSATDQQGALSNINGDRFFPCSEQSTPAGACSRSKYYPLEELKHYVSDLTDKALSVREKAFRASINDPNFDPTVGQDACITNPTCKMTDFKAHPFFKKSFDQNLAMQMSFTEDFDPNSVSRSEAMEEMAPRYFDRHLYKALGGKDIVQDLVH